MAFTKVPYLEWAHHRPKARYYLALSGVEDIRPGEIDFTWKGLTGADVERDRGDAIAFDDRPHIPGAAERIALDFERVLKIVSEFLRDRRFPFAVIGAFGLYAYGRARTTQDLDFVTVGEAQSELVAYLGSIGYETIHLSSGYSNHLHSDASLGRVDFVYVTGETSTKLFEAATGELRLGNLSVPVPRPEHLIAMKVFAVKNDPGRRFQEMADIQFLMRQPGIDEREVRSYFEEYGLLEAYDEIKKPE